MNQLLLSQPNGLTAIRSAPNPSPTALRSTGDQLDAADQARRLASLAMEHQVSDKLEANVLPGGVLCKVVLVLSLSSILLASAVLATLLASVAPGMLPHLVH